MCEPRGARKRCHFMLVKNLIQKRQAKGFRFAVVASQYNARFVDSMTAAALDHLRRAGAAVVDLFRVPGAFEIPVVVGELVRRKPKAYDAVICLGLIVRGETTHADHIGQAVTESLASAQMQYGIPLIHEVLVVANEAQATARCLDPEKNRGVEAAQTAVSMAQLMASMKSCFRVSRRSRPD